MDYQDCIFHSIAHLLCNRYAIINGQETFATGIRKWSKHLTDFPTPKFTKPDCTTVACIASRHIHPSLPNIHNIQVTLIDTGPRPFTLKCLSPWGHVLADPDISSRADVISDTLANVRVLAATDRLTPCTWLRRSNEFRPGTRLARR